MSHSGDAGRLRPNSLKSRTPPDGGVLSNSALARALAGLLGRLLRLLPRVLGGLLTLLAWLVSLIALLRLGFVVLIHNRSPKVCSNII
jgi:hypothetical protein